VELNSVSYAMADSNQDDCIKHVLASSVAENAAIEFDRAGDVKQAIEKYQECEQELAAAIAAALPAHAGDHPKLVQHRQEILDRIKYLKSLNGGLPTIPIEQQIKAVQLGMQATRSAGGVKTLAAVTAMGAAGGAIVLGSTIGLTFSAIGGAAAAAYCATRNDKVGDAARSAGNVALAGVDKMAAINKEHKITDKMADAGAKAATTAKAVNDKYGITDKISKGVGAAVSKAQDIENKHHVTDKVATGMGKGLTKLTSALDSASKRASGSSKPEST